jgi:hypothetical protein
MIVSTTKQPNKESKLMANDTLKLTDEKVLNYAREGLKAHLPLQAEGYKCTTDDLLNVLLGVAANCGTIESVCRDLTNAPHPETVRQYLNEQLCVEDLPNLERCLNAALAGQMPQRIWKKPQQVAIDFHDEPYYGKRSQEEGLWIRGRMRDGTTHFYRVATAYVMLNHLHVTLAIRFVLPEDDTLSVLKYLLRRLKFLKIDLAGLFLDKGFAGITEMRFLSKLGTPALIACSIRGKEGGTRTLCQGDKSYLTSYTFQGRGGKSFTAQLAVCRVFTTAKRTGRMQRQAKWLLFILIHLDLSPRHAKRNYRLRFGIESSYRCAGEVLGWTTSPNPAYRFTLLALGFFLLNVWVHLRWLFTQQARRGGRFLDTKRFQLSRLAKFLIRSLERFYGCLHEITALAAPLL